MGRLDCEPDVNSDADAGRPLGDPSVLSPSPVRCFDAKGHFRPITPEEQAQKARAVAAFVEKMLAMPDEDPPGAWEEAMRDLEKMLAMPDEDPPGAWEEAMRDLDAQRPRRKLFEGLY